MKLSVKLAPRFSTNARLRGETYRLEGRVHIDRTEEGGVSASVRGSASYRVDMDWQDNALRVDCNCPYFLDNVKACKHIWATLLVAEERGLLEKAASVTKIVLDPDDLRRVDVSGFSPMIPKWGPRVAVPPKPPAPLPPPSWKAQITAILDNRTDFRSTATSWPPTREIRYVVEAEESRVKGALVLSALMRQRKKNGEWTETRPLSLKGDEIQYLPDAEDRRILSILKGGQSSYRFGGYNSDFSTLPQSYMLNTDLASSLLPVLARTGRAFMRAHAQAPPEQWPPLSWDDSEPWNFALQIVPATDEDAWQLQGELRRHEERLELGAATLIVPGIVFIEGGAAPLDAGGDAWKWIAALRSKRFIRIPRLHEAEFIEHLLTRADLPSIALPPELTYEEMSGDPLPHVSISRITGMRGQELLHVDLYFDYTGQTFKEDDARRGIFDPASRRFFARNRAVECHAAEVLDQLGAKRKTPGYWDPKPRRELNPKKLPILARELVNAGWRVEAEGAVFRKPAAFRMEVASGVDWFELHGQVDFEGATAKLPELLAALRRGDNMVRLDDGTFGMLPEEWLQKIAPLAGMGEATDGHIRFGTAQTGLLDALLAAQPEATCDEAFSRIRRHWRDFQGIQPAQQPAGFAGRLRDYQAEGLGWMHFLGSFKFGGCLADDMGVGKTAQVLALLEERRELRAAGKLNSPSLVVVPRSLVFNWKDEASRFTPSLRVLDYTAPSRGKTELDDYDVILTTYGTLRRDIAHLKDIEFDYVVLDEAQAVKNAATVSSKAVRLLRGRHRLALSGTPVENHLGELWTLFEFLNPGMLGASGAFQGADGKMRNPDEDTRRMLAHAVRPFILRRTKEQVARELPAKTEQTVYCELSPAHRKLYDELREHYRRSLLGSAPKWPQSKLMVLEALLRLRQAACHPGLLDAKRADESSAKLEILLDQLDDVLQGGHKALVFSQFTSLLKIVRDRLDGEQIVYEYLDGATRNRKERVERFQTDENCRLFLISLKAGGLGLNLTAAEYVFILDPWWNPAAEAQAVDRAHRIGQERPVFAYRLIARDTVEEKVLELQKSKRALADAIIGADNSLIRDLRPEDLALLLS